ncbi:MAG TPA: hypothetical protein VKT73_09410 [Xanthobacteraceae bacterium]|nr:hypothetical protein [Xanthobacteraceae bacterium]
MLDAANALHGMQSGANRIDVPFIPLMAEHKYAAVAAEQRDFRK